MAQQKEKIITFLVLFFLFSLSVLSMGYFFMDRAYALPSLPALQAIEKFGKENIGSRIAGILTKPVDCDYVLQQGTIVDGSGGTPYIGNVAVKGDKIVAVGDFKAVDTAQKIDAAGLYIAPGFIDIHTHTEDYWLAGGAGAMVLRQGVTTQIGGNCGTSKTNIAAYLDSLHDLPINVGLFTGYDTLRAQYLAAGEAMTEAVLQKMQAQLAASIQNGSFGLSVGLEYYPQSKATAAELIRLAATVKQQNALFSMHIRSESNGVIPAVEEAIAIAEKSGVRFEYSHIKASGKQNWAKQDQILALFDAAIARGADIRGDAYGYTFSSHDLDSGADTIAEANVIKVLQNPNVMVGSDSGLDQYGRAIHPRAYGNASKILADYVRDQKVLTIEQAIHKMTQMPAKRLGMTNRGLLKEGYQADIAVFRLEAVKDNSQRKAPNLLAEGMSYVFVNGKPALSLGQVTGARGGVALRFAP